MKVTINTLEFDGVEIRYREVYLPEYKQVVKVAQESAWYSGEIGEGNPIDQEIYCYVPDSVFNTYSDVEFSEYVISKFN